MFNNTRGYPQLRAGFGYPYTPDFSGTRHTSRAERFLLPSALYIRWSYLYSNVQQPHELKGDDVIVLLLETNWTTRM